MNTLNTAPDISGYAGMGLEFAGSWTTGGHLEAELRPCGDAPDDQTYRWLVPGAAIEVHIENDGSKTLRVPVGEARHLVNVLWDSAILLDPSVAREAGSAYNSGFYDASSRPTQPARALISLEIRPDMISLGCD